VPHIVAPADYYADSPIYVGNEQPTERLRKWAEGYPGFEMLWIDRQHLGWVVLAFSVDADARQADVRREFPDVGVAVAPVTWHRAHLEELQRQAMDLQINGERLVWGAGSGSDQGVVSLNIGVLSPERIAAVEQAFPDELICVEGLDPATMPVPGPQQQSGDGWRLLADADLTGEVYRTGIAFDDQSYEELWTAAGLTARLPKPDIDFNDEVAIWFGAVHGSSCPKLRLDDVIADREKALVYANIVLLTDVGICTADAAPHAYVVALERSRLPEGPFAIQLGADEPPSGVPGERTIVETDLSAPGSVAGPDEVHPWQPGPPGWDIEPGGAMEPGYPVRYRQPTICGVEWLGPLNGLYWHTDPGPEANWIPPEWLSAAQDGAVILTLDMDDGSPPTLTATASDHSVVYQASPAPGACD